MAKFFVGQRVRKVFTPNPKAPVKVGTEGVVTSLCGIHKGTVLKNGTVLSEDNDLMVRYGTTCFFEVSRYIEPIIPEGHAPSIYSYEELMGKVRAGENA